MKANIDLTENRIFSGNLNLSNRLVKELLPKMPWDRYIMLVESDNNLDLEKQRMSIVAAGNKSERARIRYYRQMDDSNYCDCCGAAVNKMPWYMEFGLCRKCDDYYKNRRNKFFWDIKEVIQNARILDI